VPKLQPEEGFEAPDTSPEPADVPRPIAAQPVHMNVIWTRTVKGVFISLNEEDVYIVHLFCLTRGAFG
jgi:hypothetical protein